MVSVALALGPVAWPRHATKQGYVRASLCAMVGLVGWLGSMCMLAPTKYNIQKNSTLWTCKLFNSSQTQTTPKTQTHFNPRITQWQTRAPCPNPGHKLPSWSPWEPKSAPAARNFTAVRGRALFLVHDPQNNVHKFASKPSKPAFLKKKLALKSSLLRRINYSPTTITKILN